MCEQTKVSTYHHHKHIVEEILQRLHQLRRYLSELLDSYALKQNWKQWEKFEFVWLNHSGIREGSWITTVNSIFDGGVNAPQLFLLGSLKYSLIHLIFFYIIQC